MVGYSGGQFSGCVFFLRVFVCGRSSGGFVVFFWAIMGDWFWSGAEARGSIRRATLGSVRSTELIKRMRFFWPGGIPNEDCSPLSLRPGT